MSTTLDPHFPSSWPIITTIGPYPTGTYRGWESGYVTEPTTTMPPMNQIPGACPWCSSTYSATFHSGRCPKVRAIEYHPDGRVKRVEFNPEP